MLSAGPIAGAESGVPGEPSIPARLNDKDLLLGFFTTMVRIRRFDERVRELFLEGHVKGTAHSYVWASPRGVEGSVKNPSTPGGWNGTETTPETIYAGV